MKICNKKCHLIGWVLTCWALCRFLLPPTLLPLVSGCLIFLSTVCHWFWALLAGGLVDLDNNLSGRFKNLIITLIAFATSSAGATLSLEFGWLFVPLAVLSTFILVMLGSIGQRYSTIAFGTLVVSVYASLTYMPETTWYTNTLLILAGALLYG